MTTQIKKAIEENIGYENGILAAYYAALQDADVKHGETLGFRSFNDYFIETSEKISATKAVGLISENYKSNKLALECSEFRRNILNAKFDILRFLTACGIKCKLELMETETTFVYHLVLVKA